MFSVKTMRQGVHVRHIGHAHATAEQRLHNLSCNL